MSGEPVVALRSTTGCRLGRQEHEQSKTTVNPGRVS